jgi:hypothetical protein
MHFDLGGRKVVYIGLKCLAVKDDLFIDPFLEILKTYQVLIAVEIPPETESPGDLIILKKVFGTDVEHETNARVEIVATSIEGLVRIGKITEINLVGQVILVE